MIVLYSVLFYSIGKALKMAVAEIIYTKNECFTIMDNGYIMFRKRQKGEKFEPTKPLFIPRQKPVRPEPSNNVIEDHNIWGQVIDSIDTATLRWNLECKEIDYENEKNLAKENKKLKERIASIRIQYNQQEQKRRIREKQQEKEKRLAQRRLDRQRRISAHAYVQRIIQNSR